MGIEALTTAERYPLLTEAGRAMLRWLYEHPHAPRFNHHCGDRLTSDTLRQVQAFERRVLASGAADRWGWTPGHPPRWVAAFATRVLRTVPFYRRHGLSPTADFGSIPPCDRGDLGRTPWDFVPDDQPLDQMVMYATSGTTGHPVIIASHPVTSSKYLPLLRSALTTRGVTLEGGPGRVSMVLVCNQRSTYTFGSVSTFLDWAGFAKVNLAPSDWRDPDDRAKFFDACQPEIYTGDPISFSELMRLPINTRPKALVSSALALGTVLRERLEAHFGCPVIDVYSMNETGPIAVGTRGGHALLPRRLYVEILDNAGVPCPPGTRGEIVVTSSFDPYLPLLRYRTGDHAALAFDGHRPVLVGLEGRPPVVFHATHGRQINSIDVTQQLDPFGLPQFALHQTSDGALHLRVSDADADLQHVQQALLSLFGPDQTVSIDRVDSIDGPQYTRQDDLS
jgi:phenylacetate-CoA ligase